MPLKSGPAVTGQLGYSFNGNTDAIDWFKIVVPKEGSVTFSTRTETTLRLSWLGLYIPNAEGTAVDYRTDKNMDAQGNDTTVTFSVNALGAGTYYVRLRRYNGYGGYTLKYEYERNPWDRDNLQNGTFAPQHPRTFDEEGHLHHRRPQVRRQVKRHHDTTRHGNVGGHASQRDTSHRCPSYVSVFSVISV